MSVPAGYRATEVGVIPEDWEVENLGRLLSQKPSYGINAPAVAYDDRLPRYLRITDIAEDGTFSASSAVSVCHPLAERYYLEAGDVVFARTGASTGKSYRYRETDGRLVYAGFLIRVTPDPKRLNSTYLAAHVRTRNFDKYVAEVSQRSGQPGINSKQLSAFELAIPPTVMEQAAIAETLSDMDEAIAAQEAVIAKKRALKTATMQALLSGTRRLPGFTGEWEEKALDKVCPMQRGFDLPTKQIRPGKVPVVYSNGISAHHDKAMVKGPGIVTGRSGTIGNVHFVEDDFWPHNTSLWVTSMCGNDARFLVYFLRRLNLSNFSSGSGVPTLNRNDFHSHRVKIPETAEQTAIANVLFDMDLDLANSEKGLAKLKVLKVGMMQQLLTGKIRLV